MANRVSFSIFVRIFWFRVNRADQDLVQNWKRMHSEKQGRYGVSVLYPCCPELRMIINHLIFWSRCNLRLQWGVLQWGLSNTAVIMGGQTKKNIIFFSFNDWNKTPVVYTIYVLPIYMAAQTSYYWYIIGLLVRYLYYLSHHHVEFEINSNIGRQELLITYCPIKIIRILNIFINVRPHPPKISSGPEVCRSSAGLISNVRGDIFQPSWPDSTRRVSSSSPEQLFKLA